MAEYLQLIGAAKNIPCSDNSLNSPVVRPLNRPDTKLPYMDRGIAGRVSKEDLITSSSFELPLDRREIDAILVLNMFKTRSKGDFDGCWRTTQRA